MRRSVYEYSAPIGELIKREISGDIAPRAI